MPRRNGRLRKEDDFVEAKNYVKGFCGTMRSRARSEMKVFRNMPRPQLTRTLIRLLFVWIRKTNIFVAEATVDGRDFFKASGIGLFIWFASCHFPLCLPSSGFVCVETSPARISRIDFLI